MRALFILISIILTTTMANAEGLNANASYIRTNYPTAYKNSLRKYALVKWKDDFAMVVYEINEQSDAITELTNEFKSKNTNIAFKAIQKWSRDGYISFNLKIFKKMKSFELKDLLRMNCDWSMVKYEYDEQVTAKNSF